MMNFVYTSILLLGLGCSDYNLFEKNTEADSELTPVLLITPAPLDMGVVCASALDDTSGEITLQNVGEGSLSILALETEG